MTIATLVIVGMIELFLITLMVISTVKSIAQVKNATKMMSLMSEEERTKLILRELKNDR